MISRGNGVTRWRGRAIRLAAPIVLAAVCPSMTSAGGLAIDELSEDGIQLAGALPDDELDSMRGGFSAGPYDISLGFEILTGMGNSQAVSRWSFTERQGNRAIGTLIAQVQNLPSVPTVSSSGGTVVFTFGQAEVTHDLNNGVMSIVRNRNNDVKFEQTIKVNLNVHNYTSAMPAMRARVLANDIAAQVQRSRR